MPDWLKALVVVIVLGGWLATVVTTLIKGGLPDATLLGVPAAVLIPLMPPITIGRNRASDTTTPTGEAEQNP